jgi:hypothetical protein
MKYMATVSIIVVIEDVIVKLEISVHCSVTI